MDVKDGLAISAEWNSSELPLPVIPATLLSGNPV